MILCGAGSNGDRQDPLVIAMWLVAVAVTLLEGAASAAAREAATPTK